MGSIWDKNLKISIFGESHGTEIGCVIDGLPSGIELDLKKIQNELDRRSAKRYELATPRKEEDKFEIVSGFFNGYTTGTPLCAVIKNKNTKSKDYRPDILRPGHADYSAYKRYSGYQDYRGGGHFSGRITAPLVIAGAVSKQVINKLQPDLKIGSRIYSIKNLRDVPIEDWQEYYSLDLTEKKYPFVANGLDEKLEDLIKKTVKNKDSVGGIIEGWATGVPAGLGNPFFGSIESDLSSLLFSIPAVKGVEFGSGFDITTMYGSQANDALRYVNDELITETNNNGGINGGISNGMPIVFRVAVKPTPTIKKLQKTVNYKDQENIFYKFKGRHDPSIILRIPVIIESVTAICLLNLLL